MKYQDSIQQIPVNATLFDALPFSECDDDQYQCGDNTCIPNQNLW